MADLIPTLTNQLNTFINIFLSERISTGNKIKDNAILTIGTTLAAVCLTYSLNFLIKGGWKLTLRKMGLFNFHPTDFAPESIEVPKKFTFVLSFSTDKETLVFSRWMMEKNLNKFKEGTITLGYSLYNITDSKHYEDEEQTISKKNWDDVVVRDTIFTSIKSPVPIWIGSDGEAVFLTKRGGEFDYQNPNNEGEKDDSSLYLSSNSVNSIKEVCNDIINFDPSFKSISVDRNRNKLYEIVPVKNHRDENRVEKKFLGYINPRKTFNILHFRQKNDLISLINKFRRKEIGTIENGLENKIGILLYGPPGTGKSGVIQAIANYTHRSVKMINLSNIKTKSQLDDAFNDKRSEYIFVFEEIDCMGDLVQKRDNEVKKSENTDLKELKDMMMMSLVSNSRNNGPPRNLTDSKITIGDLLLKIDGMEDNENSIFIATTNHIDKLDPALIRPGRFGFHLEMSYATKQMICDILCMMFNIIMDSNRDEIYRAIGEFDNGIIESVGIACKAEPISKVGIAYKAEPICKSDIACKAEPTCKVGIADVWTPTQIIEICQIQKDWRKVLEFMSKNKP